MTWSEMALLILVVLLVAGWLAWLSASRLDRLHRKVVASRMALDGQLVRRAAAASELATSGELDPATSVLILAASTEVFVRPDAADRELLAALPDLAGQLAVDSGELVRPSRAQVSRALDNGLGSERAQAESDLSATLREALVDEDEAARLYCDPDSAQLLSALAGTWYRVQLARRFHNESVAQARELRQNPLVRLFHLAGRAAMPQTVDLDDAWPSSLRRPDAAASGVG